MHTSLAKNKISSTKGKEGAGKTLSTIKLQETGRDTRGIRNIRHIYIYEKMDMGKQREKEKKSVGQLAARDRYANFSMIVLTIMLTWTQCELLSDHLDRNISWRLDNTTLGSVRCQKRTCSKLYFHAQQNF